MNNPFVKNNYLMPEASLNKAELHTLGGLLALPPNVQGKAAIDLVSAELFNLRLDGFFRELGIDVVGSGRYELFIEMTEHGESPVKQKAQALVSEFGRSLGYILLMLKQKHPDNQKHRADWTTAHWEYWQSISRIYLSGGLTYGKIGKWLKAAAECVFEQAGLKPYHLSIARDSGYLPLLGAYQQGGRHGGNVVMMDFGHTYVKRGYAVGNSICILDKIESIVHMENDAAENEEEKARLLSDFIVAVLTEACLRMESGAGKMPDVAAVSIANYVDCGDIYYHRGEYGKLKLLQTGSVYQEYLTRIMGQRLGKPLKVLLIHDGTAAAYGVDDSHGAAVITLGTGLGVGFCDMNDRLFRRYRIVTDSSDISSEEKIIK